MADQAVLDVMPVGPAQAQPYGAAWRVVLADGTTRYHGPAGKKDAALPVTPEVARLQKISRTNMAVLRVWVREGGRLVRVR